MGAHADVPVDGLSAGPNIDPGGAGAPLVAPAGLLLRRWHDEPLCVAFVPASNTTHLLTLAAGEVLQAALEGRLQTTPDNAETVMGLLGAGMLRPFASA